MILNALVIAASLLAAKPAEDKVPTFKAAWKVDLPAESRRVNVVDFAGDKKLSLLVLDKAGTLTVHSLGEKLSEKEASVELGDQAEQYAVGAFQKDKPVVIALPKAVYVRKGATFEKKASQGPDAITGMVRFKDGTENFFFFAGSGGDPTSYAIDLSKDNPVISGQAMPEPHDGGDYKNVVLHVDLKTVGFLDNVPDEAKRTNCLGFFATSEGSMMMFFPWLENNNASLALLPFSSLRGGEFKPAWKTPKLAGKIVDVALGPDIKTGKGEGIYLLQATGEDGKGRVLEYWTPEK